MSELPTIVLVHGAWADGSCWSAVVKTLQAKGYDAIAPHISRIVVGGRRRPFASSAQTPVRPDDRGGALLWGTDHDCAERRCAQRRRPGLYRGLRT